MKASSPHNLALEANYIHRSLFGTPAPPIIESRYRDAITHFNWAPSETLARMRDLDADLEAIDMASSASLKASLRPRIQILSLICESSGSYYDHYYNRNSGPISGYAKLAVHGLRTTYKFAKGKILLWRYSFV